MAGADFSAQGCADLAESLTGTLEPEKAASSIWLTCSADPLREGELPPGVVVAQLQEAIGAHLLAISRDLGAAVELYAGLSRELSGVDDAVAG